MKDSKLYRSDGYIGGVCAGLGDWSNIPTILWRLAFIFMIPLGVYIGLWIFVKRKSN
jgi:phage shock protein PspC (stress-responsive transcriptional regulator)